MKHSVAIVAASVAVLSIVGSCAPRARVTEVQRAPALPQDCRPFLFATSADAPGDALYLGEARYGDTGFSLHCSVMEIRERLRTQACQTGADAIKIVKENFPNIWTSSCYRVQAKFYRLAATPPAATRDVLGPFGNILPWAAPATQPPAN